MKLYAVFSHYCSEPHASETFLGVFANRELAETEEINLMLQNKNDRIEFEVREIELNVLDRTEVPQ